MTFFKYLLLPFSYLIAIIYRAKIINKKNMKISNFVLLAFVLLCTACAKSEPVSLISFEDCMSAGGDIAESYPRQCFFGGESFVEDLGGENNNNEIFCVNDGGSWEKVGRLQSYDCVYKYSDGGMECDSSENCQGTCIVTEIDGSDPRCSIDSSKFGCKSTIESFKEEGNIICID